ncbi:50S ribosomal protein L32 [bacterium HR34]|nr:50S ribosomal protein L32 [bacterium HR34]
MAAVPKKHTTKGKRNNRRMHIFIKQPNLISCPHCLKKILPHKVCPYCGYYKGIEFINVLEKIQKKEEKKKKEREELKQ